MEEKTTKTKALSNMEAICAKHGSEIVKKKPRKKEDAKKLETVVRNSLAVMREEGLFAFYLFLRYRWKEGGKVIWPQIKALWNQDSVGGLLSGKGDDRDQVIELTENLNDILLAREITERALVYALYGLRAEDEKAEAKEPGREKKE